MLLGALVALAGCTGHGAPDAARPIELLVANDAETLDPRYATDAVAIRATRLVHAGLARLDPVTLEPRPFAARAWRWLDATTLRVELRDDVRFHSGAALRSADVVATLRAFASPTVASRHARVVDAIDRAEPDGDGAVIVRLKRPHATLLTDLELPILRADQAEAPADPRGALDGIGPYVVTHVERGMIALAPAGGVMPRPAHAVVVRTVHDENARALRLHAGRADVALNLVSPTLLPALEGGGLAVTSRPGSNLTYLVVREGRGALASRELRRAISFAIDRELVTRTLLGGRAHAATGVIPPTHWAFSPGADAPTHSPDRARALLRDLGTPHVRLSLLTSTDRLRVGIARLVAQELAEVGIELEVIPLELGTLLSRLASGDFELAALQMPELTEPHLLRWFLHGDFAPPAGANRGRVADATLDALLDEGGRTTDLAARRRVYAAADARIREEMHVIPLWQEDQVAVTSARARAFVPSAEGRWLSIAELP